MKSSPRPEYRPTKFSISVALAGPASPTPKHPPSPPLSRPPPEVWYAPAEGVPTASPPPHTPPFRTAFSVPQLAEETYSEQPNSRHLKNNFDILFLQEINHAPILPHVYAYDSGTKATIVSNISQDKHSRGEHGSVLV